MLFFFRGDLVPAERFFARWWPEARAIADPTGALYDAFGITNGNFRTLFGPAVFAAFFRALRTGARVGRASANPTREAGCFVVARDAILWRHPFAHVGDHPDFPRIPRLAGLS